MSFNDNRDLRISGFLGVSPSIDQLYLHSTKFTAGDKAIIDRTADQNQELFKWL